LGLPIPEGPGEVFLPDGLAAGQLRVGDSVSFGATGPAGFAGRQYRVSGVFGTASSDALLGEAVVMPLDELLDLRQALAAPTGPETAVRPALAGPNSFAVWQRDPGDLEGLRRRVATLFPDATLWWAGLPASRAYQSVGGFLSPGNLVLALTFVLAGLGVFNVMLLSLLQRKVQLGVLKALGAENDEVFLLLLLEGSFMAVGGTLLGLGGGLALVRLLDRASLVPLHLTVGILLWALALAATSFLLAAWLPATLCRRASPIQLMAGRRLYVNPRSTCAQCGRCGGF
jgi:putative ABC transport system permease protein